MRCSFMGWSVREAGSAESNRDFLTSAFCQTPVWWGVRRRAWGPGRAGTASHRLGVPMSPEKPLEFLDLLPLTTVRDFNGSLQGS